jgi:hypothetical protein
VTTLLHVTACAQPASDWEIDPIASLTLASLCSGWQQAEALQQHIRDQQLAVRTIV